MRLPERVVGVAVRDGRAVGLDLPSLDARGAAPAWREALGPGPYYVRFEDRAGEPPLGQVQRLALLGEVWLDAPVHDVDAALELLIAGASRLVLWDHAGDLLAAIGDSAVVGWDGSVPLATAVEAAKPHLAPVVALAPATDTTDPGLYQAPPQPWTGPFEVLHVGPIGDDADAGDSEDE